MTEKQKRDELQEAFAKGLEKPDYFKSRRLMIEKEKEEFRKQS